MSVQVAVRVRPFNNREIELGSELCVAMEGTKTTLIHFEDSKKNRDFFFDFSFWSHSGFEQDETGLCKAVDQKYCDQRKVYDLVGAQMLDNAWEGYHCCLLAYGQTGAGKSYSMVGYKPNRGIVPIACEEIFKRISANNIPSTEYEVCVSMLEIYNEKVQDLLIPCNKRPQGGLRIRENKTIGFYVEHLTKYPVKSYEAIEQRMEEGSKNRTIASTQMNASSSRAHTIITVEFRKREMVNDKRIEKFSMINLVDLAGSEKVGKTGATGDRLKEAGQINKSLHILGLVISTLAELESGKKNIKVPYRDSCLTKILCNALGGNSKTLMICAISPSNDNYDETLSTLRYADQAKKIKNKAIINESAVDKLIRELTQENQKLKSTIQELRNKMLQNPNNLSAKEVEELEDELQAMDELMNDMKITHQQRVEEYEKEEHEQEENEDDIIEQKIHLTNLNEDPVLNNKIKFSLDKEYIYVGRKNATPLPDIVLGSMGIKEKHAIFIKSIDKLYLVPYEESCSEYIHLNGERVNQQIELYHMDRIVFGTNSTFLVIIPNGKQREGDVLPKEIDWEFAQEEISKKSDKLINKNAQNKELELREETIRKLKEFEQQRLQEKEENEVKINEQKLIYEQKLVELEGKMKEESEKQKLEKEKLEAERQWNEIVQKLEAERIQKELEREKQKQTLQAEEQMRLYKIRSKQSLEQKLQRALPKIYEVGFISKELKRDIIFSPKILYTYADQCEINTMKERSKMPKIQILVQNNEEGSEYVWDLEKFQNRYYIIKGLLDRYFETNQIPDLQQNEDPFWDPPEPFLIGQGFLKLLGLAYGLDSQTQITLVGDNGQCGYLNVGFIPCNETGDVLYDDENNEGMAIEDPNDLLNQRLDFKLFIKDGSLPQNFCTDTFVEYSLLASENYMAKYKTKKIEGKNPSPNYNYSVQHTYTNIQQNVIKYLSNNTLQFKVFGFDDARIEKMKRSQQNRKNIMNQKRMIPVEEQMEKQKRDQKAQQQQNNFQEGKPQILKIENKFQPQKVTEYKPTLKQDSYSSANTSLSGSKINQESPEKQQSHSYQPSKNMYPSSNEKDKYSEDSQNSSPVKKINQNPPLSARYNNDRTNTEPNERINSFQPQQEGKPNNQNNETKRRNSQDDSSISKKQKNESKANKGKKGKDQNCNIF
ncbi:kinesin motor catalytic domain protein (macronuclear) [Tetrahymena thermophila SB210]|uniref:Kinesin motor catalytic domain protein n=1 Tax=Tetrahymena thermophila (strain SB210) TaxID=312017 RepID=I7M1D5_TETTS|nr:kinesin motor catalytic domain protein [Tetrahymena thermophila SB210]EAR96121.2 kinesin motor catalytic domain protein [Tetrahymena thermophila SB210]|eukprot:XP_001016366.2 kinesin motor catalytic domain protein [Tetrahymena thermophila SB210]